MSELQATSAAERLSELRAASPPDFVAPPAFMEVIAGELPEIAPWWWLIGYKGKVAAWSQILAEQFPQRVLIPFAKHGSTDDVFCFDGTNSTGDSPVWIVHSFTTPGWEDRGAWTDFDTWLSEAYEVTAQWNAEQADDGEF